MNPEQVGELLGPSDVLTSPTYESVIEPDLEPVLQGSFEIRGESGVGEFIVDSLLTTKTKMLVMGEPGNGKTSFVTNVATALERNAGLRGINVVISLKFYDEYLADAERSIGPRENWGPDDWRMFNEMIVGDITTPQVEDENGKRHITLVELPAVGIIDFRDRGLSGSQTLLQGAGNGENSDMLFAFIVCNRVLQLRTSFLRTHILDQTDEDVVSELARYNHFVDELPGENKVTVGQLVKGLFQKAAHSEHITQIRSEEEQKIGEWLARMSSYQLSNALAEDPNASRDARDYAAYEQLERDLAEPPGMSEDELREFFNEFGFDDKSLQLRIEQLRDSAFHQALYMEDLFRNQYGLAHSDAIIVHNPYNRRPMHIGKAVLLHEMRSNTQKKKNPSPASSEEAPAVPDGRIKYVGFDLDGTLIDSMTAGPEIFGAHMAKLGLDRKAAQQYFLETLGTPTATQIRQLLLQDGQRMRRGKAIRLGNAIDLEFLELDSGVFPEIKDMLDRLVTRGYKLFISSSHKGELIERKLDALGLRDYFTYVIGKKPRKQSFTKGEPHLRVVAKAFGVSYEEFLQSAVYIGDSREDVRTAVKAGIIAIGREGTFDKKALLDDGASEVLDDLSGLPELLLTL